jgi:hypothetical protein
VSAKIASLPKFSTPVFCHSFSLLLPPFHLFWWCGDVCRPISLRFMPRSPVGDGECGWPDGFCGTGRGAVDIFERKSPLEPPAWGRLSRRRRENAVILARRVSAPLGWRRKKTLTGPFFGAYCHSFLNFPAHFPHVPGGLAACVAVFGYVLWCNHRRGRGVRMARWILRYGTRCRGGYLRGKKPL